MSTQSGSDASILRREIGRLDNTRPFQIHRRPSWRHFVFRFVAGFEHSGFVYLVTVQREFPESPESSLITRLVRLCPRDAGFRSYTELTLGCDALWNSGPAAAAQLASKVRSLACTR